MISLDEPHTTTMERAYRALLRFMLVHALGELGEIQAAATRLGVRRQQVYRWCCLVATDLTGRAPASEGEAADTVLHFARQVVNRTGSVT